MHPEGAPLRERRGGSTALEDAQNIYEAYLRNLKVAARDYRAVVPWVADEFLHGTHRAGDEDDDLLEVPVPARGRGSRALSEDDTDLEGEVDHYFDALDLYLEVCLNTGQKLEYGVMLDLVGEFGAAALLASRLGDPDITDPGRLNDLLSKLKSLFHATYLEDDLDGIDFRLFKDGIVGLIFDLYQPTKFWGVEFVEDVPVAAALNETFQFLLKYNSLDEKVRMPKIEGNLLGICAMLPECWEWVGNYVGTRHFLYPRDTCLFVDEEDRHREFNSPMEALLFYKCGKPEVAMDFLVSSRYDDIEQARYDLAIGTACGILLDTDASGRNYRDMLLGFIDERYTALELEEGTNEVLLEAVRETTLEEIREIVKYAKRSCVRHLR